MINNDGGNLHLHCIAFRSDKAVKSKLRDSGDARLLEGFGLK